MNEIKTVGPNLKSYYYYTNNKASEEDVKGVIVIASGMEGTGSLYNQIGDMLDEKGYALYANDELGYGKSGKIIAKVGYKNWRRKDSYFAAYNIHALVEQAKRDHPNSPVYLIGNDFGAMLSLVAAKEFPENIDKLITIGWGLPRLQDVGFLITAYIRKFFLADANPCKAGHFGKNKTLAIRFERHEKYSWLSSDLDEVKRIRDAGYLDTPGSIGHYFFYYARKLRTPVFMNFHKSNKELPILFLSGRQDLTTLRGMKTKGLARFYKLKGFKNVDCAIVDGRHELLFEKNREENLDSILQWIETGRLPNEKINEEPQIIEKETDYIGEIEVVGKAKETPAPETKVTSIEVEPVIDTSELREAEDDDLKINVKK